MPDIHIINENPFASAQAGDTTSNNSAGEPTLPLSVRIGYGAPPEKPEVTRAGYYEGSAGYSNGNYSYDGTQYTGIGYGGTISFDLSSF